MILLDTNVVSEPLRHALDIRVVAWIDVQALETLFLSAITVAESRAGVALLPAGKRCAGLQVSLETGVLPLFAGPGQMLTSQPLPPRTAWRWPAVTRAPSRQPASQSPTRSRPE